MILMIHEYVSFLARWKITPKQFLLVYLIYLVEYEKRTGRKIYSRPAHQKQSILASLYHYAEWTGELDEDTERLIRARFTTGNTKYLIDVGILHPDTNPNTIEFDSLRLSDTFIDELFVRNEDFQEFWDLYPGFKKIDNGGYLTLKSCDKDEFESLYFERVINKDQHRNIMLVLYWAKRQGRINMNIVNFIKSEMWKEFEKEMVTTTDKTEDFVV